MKSNKGQAAIEFLTTYGWSFVILAAVLGLMGYFGVTSMGDRLPSQCAFDEAFSCSAYVAQTDGSFAFELVNQESHEINISKVLCIFPNSGEGLLLNFSEESEHTLARGENQTISCNHTSLGDLSLRKKDRFIAKIIYHDNSPGALPDIATVDIVSDVSSDRSIFDEYYDLPALSCTSCRSAWPIS